MATSLSGIEPVFPQRQASSEISAAADARDADNLSLEIADGLDFGSAVHRKQKFVAEVGDQHRVGSSQDRRRNRPAGNALGELNGTSDQGLNCPRAGSDVAHFHAIFLECAGIHGNEQRRLQERNRRHRDVDNFERRIRGENWRQGREQQSCQRDQDRPSFHEHLSLPIGSCSSIYDLYPLTMIQSKFD